MFQASYGNDVIADSSGNADSALIGADSLNIIFTRLDSDLQLRLHGTSDSLTVDSWYASNQHHVEQLQSQDGRHLPNSQVDQLIQAMAQFSADNGGITWDQAITERPNDVEAILATYWQPSQ